jgi:hypothetical protein
MAVMQADPHDSDVATAQTIGVMCQHIRAAAKDPLVASTARAADAMWNPEGARPDSFVRLPRGCGVFWWVKHAVKAVPHSRFKALLAAYPGKRQLLIAPSVVLRLPSPAGDCSTFSMLLAAMLESLGVSWELVTVAVEPSDPTLYSHVFVRAILADGGRVTLDGSHGKYPGWEVPRAHQFRRQVWDMAGEPIEDAVPVLSALGEYHPRRGLGDGGDTTDLSGVLSGITGGDTGVIDTPESAFTPGSAFTPAGSLTAPSGGTSSANWAAFATALARSGMTLAEINAIQPGTVVGANGQILRQTAGYAVPVGGVTASLGSGSTTMWAIAALAVLGLLAFAMKK